MYPNETIQTLMTRRSIRAYQQTQIPNEALQTIIDAGLYAPSGMNCQSWHFVVIQDKALLDRLEDACLQYARRGCAFYHAPTLILVFADKNATAPICDGSLALGNMLNAAAALGIGSCWIHAANALFRTPEGAEIKRELLDDENYESVGSIILGYADEETPTPKERRENTVTYFK